jgi:hypothetical protein
MLRFEYDAVVAFHPYRTHQPWDHGGVKLLHVDGANNGLDDNMRIQAEVSGLFHSLIDECKKNDIRAYDDNHCGFTIRSDAAGKETFYQLRFSDESLYLWLMPS